MEKEKKDITFEEAILKLENIVKELESGSCSLDETMNKYSEGMKLAKICGDKLNTASEKVNKILSENDELRDFEIPTEE